MTLITYKSGGNRDSKVYKELLPEHFELYLNIHNELYSDLDKFKEEHKDLDYRAELEKDIYEDNVIALCDSFDLAYVRVVGWKMMFITWRDVHDKIMDLLDEKYGISTMYPKRNVIPKEPNSVLDNPFDHLPDVSEKRQLFFKDLDPEEWGDFKDEL